VALIDRYRSIVRQATAFLFSKFVIWTLLVLLVVGFVLGRLRRRLRIAPDQSSRAPVLWLVNVTAEARLHRRLRSLAAQARATARAAGRRDALGRSPAQHLAVDLERELVQHDNRLVASNALDYDGQHQVVIQVRAAAKRVGELIERAAALAAHEGDNPAVRESVDSLDELEARLVRLEDAARASEGRVIEAAGRPVPAAAIEAIAEEDAPTGASDHEVRPRLAK
jgi:hypothetical protein